MNNNFFIAIISLLLTAHSFAQLPAVPEPVENPLTEEKRVLGKILFWDEQLSSDNSVACGSCHLPSNAGGDNRIGLHPGADSFFGGADDVVGSPGVVRRDSSGTLLEDTLFGFNVQVTGRHAPNFFASLWSNTQFWDGRAEGQFIDPLDGVTVAIASGGSLEIQSLGPIVSSVEMAKDDRTWAEVTEKLFFATPLLYAERLPSDVQTAIASSPTYADLFTAAYGDPNITPVRIAFALASYERSLIANQTPFDLGTLTANQQIGLNALSAVGPGGSACTSCHTPPLFTDNSFRNIGVRPPSEDTGREGVTGLANDLGRFKVPSLRNVGTKSRFMHNGSLTTLAGVLAFYAPGGQNSAENLDPLMPVPIPPPQITSVIDFLENGLTDPRVAAGTFPFDAPTITAAGAGDAFVASYNVAIPAAAAFALLMLVSLVKWKKVRR